MANQESEDAKAIEERLTREVTLLELFVKECEACQHQAQTHWQFCAHCGVRLATACPGCGSPLPPLGAHYCPHCSLELPPEFHPSAP